MQCQTQFYVVLGVEHRILSFLGKGSTTGVMSPVVSKASVPLQNAYSEDHEDTIPVSCSSLLAPSG